MVTNFLTILTKGNIMEAKIKKFILTNAITMSLAFTASGSIAAKFNSDSRVLSADSVTKSVDITAGQKTIIGGFKSMSVVDSSKATSGDLSIKGPVEPPVVIDDFAIIDVPKPPKPFNDVLTGHGEGVTPTASNDLKIENEMTVELDWMAAYIDTVMHDQVVGYAYVINKDGEVARSNAVGSARTADDGQLDMSIHTRSFIASVTKQITAIATIKILHQAGLSVDTPISDYLPDEWVQATGFWGDNGLTFKHLMAHTTGLGQAFDLMKQNNDVTALSSWGNDWDGLEYVVSNGATPGASYAYKNANYALLRVLIPEVWRQMGGAPYTEVTMGNHSIMYLAYVQQNIFEPIGIHNVGCWMQPALEEALAYSKDFVEEGGIAHEVSFNSCGGHAGFRLSAYELAKYLAYIRHSDEIISYVQLGLANQENLGWTPSDNDGNYWKGGDWNSNYTIATPNTVGGGSLSLQSTVDYSKSSHACIMTFPYGYEASIVINSEYKTGFESSACGVLKDAFEFVSQ